MDRLEKFLSPNAVTARVGRGLRPAVAALLVAAALHGAAHAAEGRRVGDGNRITQEEAARAAASRAAMDAGARDPLARPRLQVLPPEAPARPPLDPTTAAAVVTILEQARVPGPWR